MKYETLDLIWKPIGKGRRAQLLTLELYKILKSWEKTPYMEGQCAKGSGVDCIRFISSVLSVLTSSSLPLETLPSDASLHNRETTQKALKVLRNTFPPNKLHKRKTVQPGDVLVTGPPAGGPGHAMIVGTEPYTLWHTTQRTGVCKTGFSLPPKYQKVFGIYRLRNRGKWQLNWR